MDDIRGEPRDLVARHGIYFHMRPTVSVGQSVTHGQVIGHLDNSGCQSHAHLHVARKDASGKPVNFTIPCVNQTPTTQYDDGSVGDDVPKFTDWGNRKKG